MLSCNNLSWIIDRYIFICKKKKDTMGLWLVEMSWEDKQTIHTFFSEEPGEETRTSTVYRGGCKVSDAKHLIYLKMIVLFSDN